ncbi:MAG TPA: sigma-70 family RNA polymerase sigma factor [Terriglobia bacterium]|nr:sigma-70 family RNA polymerase sigma factor [Terriglobia bacterium]
MRKVASGDERALAELYDRYSGHVYSVALRILRQPAAAEEILQDIFYKLWLDAPAFDPLRGSLAGWLVVNARNRSISRLRKHNPRMDEEWTEDAVVAPENFSGAIESSLMLDLVRSALDGLPHPQRQALDLAYFEGLTHSEIAERTGEPLGTIKTRLRSALKTLKDALNK